MKIAEFLTEIQPKARVVARTLAKKYRRCRVEADDLFQEAMIAVLRLHPAYDPAAARPWTFASARVLGAMLDYLRSRHLIVHVPRSARKRGGADVRVHQLVVHVDRVHGGDTDALADTLAMGKADPDFGDGTAAEFAAAVRAARTGLFPDEIRVLVDRFALGLEVKEVAARRGVTESRGSQMIADALDRVRSAAAERGLTARTLFAARRGGALC